MVGFWLRAAALGVLALAPLALAQERLITVSLGVGGEMTPGAWNPLRVTLRDQRPSEFILQIDQGSLREGPRLVEYRARLSGGGGIRVFEDDVFLPPWRSMSWWLREGETTLASGTFERNLSDPGPLQLVVAEALGARRALLEPHLRTADVLPSELPERLAAFDGVQTVVIDPSAAPPRAEAVLAAAAAGAVVVLLEPSHPSLTRLAPAPVQRLGAGWLVRAEVAEVAALTRGLERLDREALTEALISADMRQGPRVVPLFTVLLLSAGYSAAVLLFVRFGGAAGYLASLALALVVALAAFGNLRPEREEALQSRQLSVGGGPLAWRQDVQVWFSLADSRRRFDAPGRALEARAWQADASGLELAVTRWSSSPVAQRPSLQEAGLRWDGARLENPGGEALHDLYVLGLGWQGDLAAGAVLEPRRAPPGADVPEGNGAPANLLTTGLEDEGMAASYAALAARLPEGSALAHRGARVYVALPPPSPVQVSAKTVSAEAGIAGTGIAETGIAEAGIAGTGP